MTRTGRVAIVGGGPGGAECARRLAEHGIAATLFEARTSHEKPCGGGLPARALDRYPHLRDRALPAREVRRCILIAPSGRETSIRLDDPLLIVRRADLHRYLLEHAGRAGAEIVQARVLSFERRGAAGGAAADGAAAGGWTLRVLRTAGSDGGPGEAAPSVAGPFDYLVAADGASGLIRRHLAGTEAAPGLTQGIGYYIEGLCEDAITLAFYRGLHGYLWVFPRPDHSSAGICATLGSRPARELRSLLDGFIRERYGPEWLARSTRYAALIPGAGPDPAEERRQGEGWALVGDAGREVDPLTREGIYFAMQAGTLLADCLAAGDPGRYPAEWLRLCGSELSWAARHGDGFFADRFIEALVALADRSPTVGRILSDLIAGQQPYRSLKRRLMLSAPRIGVQAIASLAGIPAGASGGSPQARS